MVAEDRIFGAHERRRCKRSAGGRPKWKLTTGGRSNGRDRLGWLDSRSVAERVVEVYRKAIRGADSAPAAPAAARPAPGEAAHRTAAADVVGDVVAGDAAAGEAARQAAEKG